MREADEESEDQGALPAWFAKAFEEVTKSLLGPGDELADLPESKRAYAVGKQIGRILAFCRQHREGFPFLKGLVLEESIAIQTVLVSLQPVVKQAEAEYRQILAEAWDHQSYSWMAKFYRGFALGFGGGVLNERGEAVAASPQLTLYLMLMLGCEEVEEICQRPKAAENLHKWAKGMMGSGFQTDVEAFRKFCQRLGIKFGPGGRPSKNCDTAEG